MCTTQERVLMRVLDCEFAELEIVDNIKYDIDEVMDIVIANEDVSLNGVVSAVAQMGAEELEYNYNVTKVAIEKSIREQIELTQDEEELEMLKDELELIQEDRLKPTKELDVYKQMGEYSITLENVDFYIRHLDFAIDEIHAKMGFEFE